MVLLSGTIYTARDAAHKRLIEMMQNGEEPPVQLEGQIVYYAGPSPAKPGQVIGSAGPTTSGRMDKYSPFLIERGLRYMIGKGERSEEVRRCITENGGVYFVAIGGAAAYIARSVKSAEVVAFDDLGTEAIRRLTVEDFPVIVSIDTEGNVGAS
ncbi:MAG: FumA C-terminus/TtdB family hydratase beta subunit [Defluviitaleaceae bacterium]|nr:FumA C-terminus/TtdB family hydratase beta subunit [Defluviitaleaceae bacterium]